MGGIADDRLIEIADLDRDAAFGVGQGAEIAEVAIAANPSIAAGDIWPRSASIR